MPKGPQQRYIVSSSLSSSSSSSPLKISEFSSLIAFFLFCDQHESEMNKFELVFIPAPWIGHLASTLEMANILITRDPRLSVTVLLMQVSVDSKGLEYIQLLSSSFPTKSIHFILLPQLPIPEECQNGMPKQLIEIYKPHVREAIINHTNSQTAPDSPRLVGFVLDMFCMTMIEVAKEFKSPCYVFYTSSAAFLALNFHLQELYDQNRNNEVVERLKNSESELALPCFVNPLPGKSIPNIFVYNDVFIWMYENTRKLRSEIEGILINTSIEIESYTINSMTTSSSVSQLPCLYSVGPILNMKNIANKEPNKSNIMKWLDNQPPESVIYLSFGSMGSFDEDQVKEIAKGLEQSGVRFLWALRKPPKKGKLEAPSDYSDVTAALPDGFVERTANVGKIIGWAPQMDVLAHPATAGFVSHCGWNSVLESVWHGVPVGAWPMYAEQQLNGFEVAVELGLGVAIALDYGKDHRVERSRLVMAEEIESGISKLMDAGGEIRKRVKEKSREVRDAVMEGGSSFVSLGCFVNDIIANSLKEK